MQNSQRAATEQNQNNLKPINLRKEKVEKGKNEKNQNNEILKKNPEERKKELELKSKILNKPIELLEFDALTHFKENIAHTYKNFLGAITEKSYYCLDCKHSDCPFYKWDPALYIRKNHASIPYSICMKSRGCRSLCPPSHLAMRWTPPRWS